MLKELEICPHLPKLLSNIKWLTFLEHGVFLQTLTIWFLGLRSQPWFYPALHNRGGGVSKNQGVSHTDIPVIYLLPSLLSWMLLCISRPPLLDRYILFNKSRQDSFLAVSVKWISVNVNMFAIHYLSQVHHSHWHCVLIQCSLFSIIG